MKKALKYTSITILIVFLLLVGCILFLLTESGKNFIKNQILLPYLSEKLNVPIQLGRLDYDIPNSIKIENFQINDLQKDTLLAIKSLKVDLDMWALINGEINIKSIESDGLKTKIKKLNQYNFDFILNAFAGDTTQKTSSNPLKISIKKIDLKNTQIVYDDLDENLFLKFINGSLSTDFDSLNLDKSLYHLKEIALKNSDVFIRKNLDSNSDSKKQNSQPQNSKFLLDFISKNISLNNTKILFEDSENGFKNELSLGEFNSDVIVKNKQIDIERVVLKDLANNSTRGILSTKPHPKSFRSDGRPNKEGLKVKSAWEINLKEFILQNNAFRYDDMKAKPVKKGLDYGHLALNNVNLNLQNLTYSDDKINGFLRQFSFNEKSGLKVNQLATVFSYSPKKIDLKNFIFKTPNSSIKNDLIVQFNSIDDFTNNLEKVQIDYKNKFSQLAINDVLILAPFLESNPQIKPYKNQILNLSLLAKGRIGDLNISEFIVSGIGDIKINLNGNLKGLPNIEKLTNSLNINQLSISKSDIQRFLPDSLIPKTIDLPNQMQLKGQVLGGINDLKINADLLTDFGNVGFNGNLKSITDKHKATYNGIAQLADFDLGKLLKVKSDSIGKITSTINLKGVGTNPKTMDLTFDASIKEAFFNRYNYRNLTFDGTLKYGILDFKSTANDTNLSYKTEVKIDLNEEYPKINLDLDLGRIDLEKLGFYKDKLILKGKFQNNLTSTNPANPLGTIKIPTISIQNDSSTIKFDSISIALSNENDLKKAEISSPFLNGNLTGNFDYRQLKDLLLSFANQYFAIPNLAYEKITIPSNFSFNSTIINHPSLVQFIPKLKQLDESKISLKFDNQSENPLTGTIELPKLKYDTLQIENAKIVLISNSKSIDYQAFMKELKYENYLLRNSELNGKIADNQINFNYVVRDSLQNMQHGIAGNLREIGKNFRLNLDDLLLNYKTWENVTSGYLNYGESGFLLNQLNLSDGKQKLSINSLNQQPNAPLEIELENIDIQGLTNAFLQDSTLAKGKINGKLMLIDYLTNPTFTGDLQIKNLEFSDAKIGDIVAIASYEGNNKITTYATLENEKDNIILSGDYRINDPQPLDYQLLIRKLSDKTIEAFSFGTLKDTKGEVYGNIHLKGSTERLIYDGDLEIDSLAFKLSSLGSRFLLQNQKLSFDKEQLVFKNFILQDSTKNKMQLNGFVNIAKLPTYSYDLQVSGKDFQVMNSTEKDNPNYFGQCFIDSDLKITGIETQYDVSGDVKINAKSKVTFAMPDEVEKEEAERVVRFVDLKNPPRLGGESKSIPIGGVGVAGNLGGVLSLNLEADENAELKIIVDQLNGDFLKVKGKASLNTSINSSGNMSLSGTYEIVDGDYDFSFQVLKYPFKIKKGSKISWTGDPMKGNIEITAYYPLEAVPYDLVANDNEISADKIKDLKRKQPFEIQMKMKGNLSAPQLTFDIATPENTMEGQQSNSNDLVNEELEKLRKNEDNMNRQVFGLLVLKKFIAENSQKYFSAISAESIARESLSKMLSEQLDKFANDLIKGVNIDLNLISEGQYGTDARTNLNVGLSKGFLNDRLTVSVGRNFELENNLNVQRNSEVFDNYALNYKITNDGRYAVRGYRLNQLQSVLEGYVVETGVSFTIVLEFDTILKNK